MFRNRPTFDITKCIKLQFVGNRQEIASFFKINSSIEAISENYKCGQIYEYQQHNQTEYTIFFELSDRAFGFQPDYLIYINPDTTQLTKFEHCRENDTTYTLAFNFNPLKSTSAELFKEIQEFHIKLLSKILTLAPAQYDCGSFFSMLPKEIFINEICKKFYYANRNSIFSIPQQHVNEDKSKLSEKSQESVRKKIRYF